MADLELPPQLFEGNPAEDQLLARIGRYNTLCELGAFGIKTMIDLSVIDEPGSFNGRVRKRFSGIYGDTRGCSEGDIECAALVADSFDEVYDYEIKLRNQRRPKKLRSN